MQKEKERKRKERKRKKEVAQKHRSGTWLWFQLQCPREAMHLVFPSPSWRRQADCGNDSFRPYNGDIPAIGHLYSSFIK